MHFKTSKSGMGKVRPVGQILPAEGFSPTRQGDFSRKSTYASCKNVILVLGFQKDGPEGPQKIKMARGPKNLPTPALSDDVTHTHCLLLHPHPSLQE
jgi:hypothetical protein